MICSVPSSRPINTCARSRSIPPGAPALSSALASAQIRDHAAAACPAGRKRPASEPVLSGSPDNSTRAFRSASSRRRSAAAGSTVITARCNAARSWPVVRCSALSSTIRSTRPARSSSRQVVNVSISFARARSMRPERSAAIVPGSRRVMLTARSIQYSAPPWVRVSASATSLGANSASSFWTGSWHDTASAGVPRRLASSATAASSWACAQEVILRQPVIDVTRPASSRSAHGAQLSQPASAGPGSINACPARSASDTQDPAPDRAASTASSPCGSSSAGTGEIAPPAAAPGPTLAGAGMVLPATLPRRPPARLLRSGRPGISSPAR